jgi:hypothetical protein
MGLSVAIRVSLRMSLRSRLDLSHYGGKCAVTHGGRAQTGFRVRAASGKPFGATVATLGAAGMRIEPRNKRLSRPRWALGARTHEKRLKPQRSTACIISR